MTDIPEAWVLLEYACTTHQDEGQLRHLHEEEVHLHRNACYYRLQGKMKAEGRLTLNFLDTTAITSSCRHALSRKVAKDAWNLDRLYADMLDA